MDLISTGLYRHVNAIVGSEDVVRVRRMVMDLSHEIRNVEYNFDPAYEASYLSGSEAEGLRFPSSDLDYMVIIRGVRVLFSLSQLPRYNNNTTLLLAECDRVRPGFVMLRLVTDTNNPFIINSSVRHVDRCYVAGSLWRSQFIYNPEIHSEHGPCTSGMIGTTEYDYAHCIKSDIWPEAAFDFIRRVYNCGWPPHDVLSNIVKDGCLVVPVGSKDSPTEDYEWRLSFSLAEKTLIHNMTHCQFLTYGLLKIFLKEAIDVNREIKGLLCFYFMKTILFWKVTQQEEWYEQNFIQNFWKCFQTLITCVISGYCPNFFIPENNMFRGKIEGKAQRKLLSHLTSLFRDGYQCLLQCPSVRDVMLQIIEQPVMALTIPGDDVISQKAVIDMELTLEIWNRKLNIDRNKQVNLASLLRFQTLLFQSSSVTKSFVIEIWMKMLIQDLLIDVTKQTAQMYILSNKKYYTTRRFITGVSMSSACDVGCHLLCLAIALYHLCDFTAVIRLLLEVKRVLQHPSLMYTWNLDVDKYRAAGGDATPLSDMMKTVVAFPVYLKLMTCIPSLELEHEAADRHSTDVLVIPPLVSANYLLFLCYRNEHDTVRANRVLDELSTLVHYDDGYHIPAVCGAISWQLLGICQEISRDYQGAYNSNNTTMQQRWCKIREAAEIRIQNMCNYLGYKTY